MKNLWHLDSNLERGERLLEAYRKSSSRPTVSKRRVRWDEPGEEDHNPDEQSHNAFMLKGLQRKEEGNGESQAKRESANQEKKARL
jgi:hypothetical protein